MELWDESRNANNAIEMVHTGNWLVTLFGGIPDHWNTKPPLFIWIVALLLKAGLTPLLALRLPSAIATAATALALFAFCRWVLLDRLAGMLSALLLLSSMLFLGQHVARTGDYDALLSLFMTLSVLAFWFYIDGRESQQGLAIYAVALALLLGILTKGVVALLIGPGLLAYAAARGRLLSTLLDRRVWAAGGVTLLSCALYYGTREMIDPGYVQAVWDNELGGRFLTTLDKHAGGRLYYLGVLLLLFQPGMLFLPLVALPLARTDGANRHAILLSLLVAAVLLIILSTAHTKAYWYAAPLVPLLSLAVGISLTQAFTLLRPIHGAPQPVIRGDILKVVLIISLCFGLTRNFYFNQIGSVSLAQEPENAQYWYATIVGQERPEIQDFVIVDHGFPNEAGFAHYNPIAEFYRKYAQVGRIFAPGSRIDPGTLIITCDPQAKDWLTSAYGFVVRNHNQWCAIGRTAATGVGAPGWDPQRRHVANGG